MTFPRVTAAVCIVLLIGCLACIGIGCVAFIGPLVIHGNVEHDAGTIVSISADASFVLQTASGQQIRFQCGDQCHPALAHIQRHLREHAHTDVYYIQGMQHSLLAIDVD